MDSVVSYMWKHSYKLFFRYEILRYCRNLMRHCTDIAVYRSGRVPNSKSSQKSTLNNAWKWYVPNRHLMHWLELAYHWQWFETFVCAIMTGVLCRSVLHWLSSCQQWTETTAHARNPRHFTLSRSAFLLPCTALANDAQESAMSINFKVLIGWPVAAT